MVGIASLHGKARSAKPALEGSLEMWAVVVLECSWPHSAFLFKEDDVNALDLTTRDYFYPTTIPPSTHDLGPGRIIVVQVMRRKKEEPTERRD